MINNNYEEKKCLLHFNVNLYLLKRNDSLLILKTPILKVRQNTTKRNFGSFVQSTCKKIYKTFFYIWFFFSVIDCNLEKYMDTWPIFEISSFVSIMIENNGDGDFLILLNRAFFKLLAIISMSSFCTVRLTYLIFSYTLYNNLFKR